VSAATEIEDLIGELVSRTGTDPQRLGAALTELGLFGIGVPERLGGSGGDLADLVAATRALGRHAVSCPLLENATAAWVLAGAGRPVPTPAATLVLTGPLRVTGGQLSSPAPGEDPLVVPWPAAGTPATGTPGTAAAAGPVVLCPETGPPLLLDLGQPDVGLEPGANLSGEPQARLVFRAAAAVEPLTGAPSSEAIVARLGLLSAARLAGALQGAFSLTQSYVSQREQFGAPLAKLPAVSRSLGLMQARVIEAEVALARALALAGDPGRALSGAQVARAAAGWAATEVARTAHQLHGAMGVSMEYPLHQFTRRLWAWRDYALPECRWTAALGATAIGTGETALWDDLTAAVPAIAFAR
jgi:acyl-CoA dehydrogenase